MIKRGYISLLLGDFRVECDWVPLQGRSHSLVSFDSVIFRVQAINTVAAMTERLVGKAFAIQLQTLRFLAVATNVFPYMSHFSVHSLYRRL